MSTVRRRRFTTIANQEVNLERSFLVLVLLGIIWGSNFLFMKIAVQVVNPIQVAWLRVIFGTVPVVTYALARNRLRIKDLKHSLHFFFLSLLSIVIPYLGLTKGTQILGSGIAGSMAGTIPLVTTVLAVMFLPEETISLRKILGIGFGLVGIGLIANLQSLFLGATNEHLLHGSLIMMAAAFGYGASGVYAKKFISPLKISALALTCYQTIFASAIMSLFVPWQGMEHFADSPAAFASVVIGLGLVGTGIAFIMYFYIVEQLGAVASAAVFYIPPVVALILGAFVAGEDIQLVQAFGCALILIGVWIAKAKAPRKVATQM